MLRNSTGKPGRKDTVRTPKPEDLPFMKNASVTSDGRVQKEVLFYLRRMKGLLLVPVFARVEAAENGTFLWLFCAAVSA